MVRTRRTNKTKRYTEFTNSPEDEDEDGLAPEVDAHVDDVSDFDAEPGEGEVNAQEDDEMSEADDDDAAEDLSDPGSSAGRVSSKKGTHAKKSMHSFRTSGSAKHGVDYHELPAYPLDTRIPTRAYTGPLKRGVRSGVLRDLMYGPQYSKAKLIWDLYERWSGYAVLPPRHPPQHPEGVLPSPWVPLGFESDQEKRAAEWYDEYSVLSTEKARSRPVLQKHGARLVPQGQGDLAVLLGPVDAQEEVRFATSVGTALSSVGLPLNEADSQGNTPDGWIFDVGGIVVALGWAPILTGNKQVLALAVIPHTDQARPAGEGDMTAEDEKGHGSIQFWEFAWDRDPGQRPRPCRSRPKFVMAKCFDWGRPKRMQWYPVSFGAAGLYGTLAVLCGDGRVRVLDVEPVQDSQPTAYGELAAFCPAVAYLNNADSL